MVLFTILLLDKIRVFVTAIAETRQRPTHEYTRSQIEGTFFLQLGEVREGLCTLLVLQRAFGRFYEL